MKRRKYRVSTDGSPVQHPSRYWYYFGPKTATDHRHQPRILSAHRTARPGNSSGRIRIARYGLMAAAAVAVLIVFYVVYDVGSYYGYEGFKAAGLSTGPARKPSVLARDVIAEGQKLNVVEKLPEPAKVVKKEPPPPPVEPPPPSEPVGNFAVQVAVVYSEQLAQPMVDKLKEAGYHAYFYRTEHKGKALYKVRVGYFETEVQAKEVENKLKSQGHKDAFISHVKE